MLSFNQGWKYGNKGSYSHTYTVNGVRLGMWHGYGQNRTRRPMVTSAAKKGDRLGHALKAVVILGVAFFLVLVTARSHAYGSSPLQRVVVAPGDTVWSIAASTASKGQDVREVVDEIETLNHLTQDRIESGMVLLIPESR